MTAPVDVRLCDRRGDVAADRVDVPPRGRLAEGGEDGAWQWPAADRSFHRRAKAAAISNHVVRTMSEYTGRGPTTARTYLNDNLITVVLQDTLTKGERASSATTSTKLVLSMRKAFQGTMRHDLINGIEKILGRKVVAYERQPHRP